jgi:hypothetical protein
MTTETTFKQAVELYKTDSGKHFIKPVKSASHYSRGGWYLLGKDGGIVAIVGADGCCLWGGRLMHHYVELARRTG